MTIQNTVLDFYRCLDELAPFSTQLSWDNSGLLVGDFSQQVHTCVLALDVTEAVVRFAREHDAQLIVTHHPVIFGAIRNVTAESLVWQLARENISVISAHTNLDLAEGGVNDALSGGLLAVKKDLVDELRHEAVVVNSIRLNLAAVILSCTTRHVISPLSEYDRVYSRDYFGRLAP